MNFPRNTTGIKLAGTETFRASSAALFGLFGGNLQNIPKDMRGMYWADDGKFLVQVDQSGAEALIVAYLCEKGRFRDLFLNGVKPHVFVAMHVFMAKWQILCKDINVTDFVKTPIPELKNRQGWKTLDAIIRESDNWEPHERYYFIAKQMCHSLNYDARADAFRMNTLEKSRGQVVLSKKQAEDYIIQYHSLFPEIHRWHYWVQEQLRYVGMITNLFRFPRVVSGRDVKESDYKEWYAFAPQSTVGCITHIEIQHEQQFIDITNHNSVRAIGPVPEPVEYCLDMWGSKPRDWDILNNNHDSSLTQCPEEDKLDCARVKTHLFNQPLESFRGEKFNMRSEAQVGRNWGVRKEKRDDNGNVIEVKNPEGLVEIKL